MVYSVVRRLRGPWRRGRNSLSACGAIGVLMAMAESDREAKAFIAAFREELQKLGWTEGRNIHINTRWAAELGLMPQFAKELIEAQPNLILANDTPTTAACYNKHGRSPSSSQSLPIPLAAASVASLSRPGGNVTGFTLNEPTMTGKWLGLLKEIAPQVPGSPSCSTRQQPRTSNTL